jgi:hypothetical protein
MHKGNSVIAISKRQKQLNSISHEEKYVKLFTPNNPTTMQITLR